MNEPTSAQADAVALARVLETIAGKLKAERGLSDHQIGAAMLQTGLKALGNAMSGPDLVDLLATATGAIMEMNGIQPSGEVVPRGRPN